MSHLLLCAAGLILCLSLSAVSSARADVKLASIFGDNMVLQRDQAVPVWGTAGPGEKVTVSIKRQRRIVAAGPDGKWMVRLDPMKAGGPFEMTVAGGNTITFRNVLVGEVWIASGQSNMQMPVHEVNEADKEIASADYPNIRICSVARIGADAPQTDLHAEWVPCSPKTVPGFSAVAYFFGRKLHQDLGVPVGIIHDSWSGSLCETWIRRETLEKLPEVQPLLAAWKKAIDVRGDKEKEAEAKYRKSLAEWRAEYAKAEPGNRPGAPWPDDPFDPLTNFQRPSGNYNGMVAPLVPYAIRGAIWYQAEGNSERAAQYRTLFPALINDWRCAWGQGDFPFLFVQISSFRRAPAEPYDSEWGQTREAQTMALKLPNTGMAVSLDAGDEKNAHYPNKQIVGFRLALVAEGKVYGRKVECASPTYGSTRIEGGKVYLKFTDVDGGLVAKGSDDLKTFQIAGADRTWVWARARVDKKDTVVVWSDKIAQPAAVRYAWMDNALAANLYNKAGLPAGTFRTDDWPVSTDGVLVWSGLDKYK